MSVVYTNTGDVYLSAGVYAGNSTAFSDTIIPTPVQRRRTLGSPTLLDNGVGPQIYTIFINGVDRSEYVRIGAPSGPGITFNRQTSARSTATFQTRDKLGLYSPVERGTVFIYESGELRYRGYVDKVVSKYANGGTLITSDVSCVDVGGLLDRAIFGRYYNIGVINAFLPVYDLPLVALGITLVYTAVLSREIGNIVFNYVPVTEVLNQIANLINADWVVDQNLNLYFYDKNTGYGTAPASILTNSKNWETFQVTRNRIQFANRIYAKSSRNIGATQTDTYVMRSTVEGISPLPMRNFSDILPTVTVNGVDKLVVPISALSGGIYAPGAPDFDFYFTGISVIYSQIKPPINIGDTVAITYPSQLSAVAIAEDPASIAAVGLQEMVIEAGDVPNFTALQLVADQALTNGSVVPDEVQFTTRTKGFEPRQLVTVNVAHPPVDDTFLIKQVASKEIANKYFLHTVTATSQRVRYASNTSRYMGMLLERSRAKIDRIIERLDFVVAGTIEGLSNPGLTVGVKNALHVAQKDSILGWVSLRFKSIDDGIQIGSPVEIDIFKNGTSIFGGGVSPPIRPNLILRAGASTVTIWKFASDPLLISRGDVFTFEIVTADATAKDGALDIIGLG